MQGCLAKCKAKTDYSVRGQPLLYLRALRREPPQNDQKRKGGRVVECAGLEIQYTVLPYRGFESLPFRQVTNWLRLLVSKVKPTVTC